MDAFRPRFLAVTRGANYPIRCRRLLPACFSPGALPRRRERSPRPGRPSRSLGPGPARAGKRSLARAASPRRTGREPGATGSHARAGAVRPVARDYGGCAAEPGPSPPRTERPSPHRGTRTADAGNLTAGRDTLAARAQTPSPRAERLSPRTREPWPRIERPLATDRGTLATGRATPRHRPGTFATGQRPAAGAAGRPPRGVMTAGDGRRTGRTPAEADRRRPAPAARSSAGTRVFPARDPHRAGPARTAGSAPAAGRPETLRAARRAGRAGDIPMSRLRNSGDITP